MYVCVCGVNRSHLINGERVLWPQSQWFMRLNAARQFWVLFYFYILVSSIRSLIIIYSFVVKWWPLHSGVRNFKLCLHATHSLAHVTTQEYDNYCSCFFLLLVNRLNNVLGVECPANYVDFEPSTMAQITSSRSKSLSLSWYVTFRLVKSFRLRFSTTEKKWKRNEKPCETI